jgi:hypothetical protein
MILEFEGVPENIPLLHFEKSGMTDDKESHEIFLFFRQKRVVKESNKEIRDSF